MNARRRKGFFDGLGKWALPLAALVAYAVSPVVGLAALAVLAVMWLVDRRATAVYAVSPEGKAAAPAPAPSKREVMRCWMLMF